MDDIRASLTIDLQIKLEKRGKEQQYGVGQRPSNDQVKKSEKTQLIIQFQRIIWLVCRYQGAYFFLPYGIGFIAFIFILVMNVLVHELRNTFHKYQTFIIFNGLSSIRVVRYAFILDDYEFTHSICYSDFLHLNSHYSSPDP